MQYSTYQHADGTDDVAPYKGYQDINYVAEYRNTENDYLIMLARMKAAARGARPIDIQKAVHGE